MVSWLADSRAELWSTDRILEHYQPIFSNVDSVLYLDPYEQLEEPAWADPVFTVIQHPIYTSGLTLSNSLTSSMSVATQFTAEELTELEPL